MSQPYRISFAFIALVVLLTGWLHLGALPSSVSFSYFAISKLDFLKPRGTWPAIAIFIALLAVAAYGLEFFVRATVAALPAIAEAALPAIIQWAAVHQITLPFTDLEGLKQEAVKMAYAESHDIGKFADFARGATRQFVYLTVGCLVAMGLFLDPMIEVTGRRRPIVIICIRYAVRKSGGDVLHFTGVSRWS